MAQRLEVKELEATRGRPALYPWADWSDGTVWQIIKGDDYKNQITMKNTLRMYASTHNLRVTIVAPKSEPGTIQFQFSEKAGQ